MLELTEITIMSADKNEDAWTIEGELIFDGDLTAAFTVIYYPGDDEFDELTLESNPGRFDKRRFKELLLAAVDEFEEE